jgi:hypothetical protein
LDDDKKVLVGEEHEVLQAGIDGRFGGRVNVWTRMGQEMEELNESANCQSLKLLSSEESLSEMHILDDLESYQLSNMHGIGSG